MISPSPTIHLEFLSCSLASLTFPPLLNPFECTKSLMQFNRNSRYFKTSYDTFMHVSKQRDGIKRITLTGLESSLGREVCYNSVRWIAYSRIKEAWGERGGGEGGKVNFISAFLSGIIGSIFSNPFDILRVRQQSELLSNPRIRTFKSALKEYVSKTGMGWLGLWNGWQVNGVRAGMFTGGSITSYTYVKGLLNVDSCTMHQSDGSEEGEEEGGGGRGEEKWTTHFIAGGVMGVVGTAMYMPADAVRGRVYNMSPLSRTNPTGMITTREILREGMLIYRNWGIRGFWKGTGAAMARTVPSCVMFPVFMEGIRNQLGLDYYE